MKVASQARGFVEAGQRSEAASYPLSTDNFPKAGVLPIDHRFLATAPKRQPAARVERFPSDRSRRSFLCAANATGRFELRPMPVSSAGAQGLRSAPSCPTAGKAKVL
jgi:hypothetical protein